MRLRYGFIATVLLGATLACSTPGSAGTTTEPPTAQVMVVTATPPPSTAGLPPAPTPSAQPTFAPSGGSGPKFSPAIKFSTEPNPVAAMDVFKPATKRIYAMWDYSGMTDGLKVRREWYLDGDLWLKREEPWDFKKYGASGTITDVSIYDEVKGLPSGQYQLQLFIDGTPQFAGDTDIHFRSFTVGAAGDGTGLGQGEGGGAQPSPDGKRSALVDSTGTLTVLDRQGTKKPLVTAKAFDGFAWMPDSAHIVYSTKTDDGSGPFGVSFDLFVVDVTSTVSTQLSQKGENLHLPVVSPDGKYIGLIKGMGYGDACAVDQVVAIMQIDPVALTRVSLTTMDQFSGLTSPAVDSQAYAVSAPDFVMPGVWQNATQFKAAVRFTCFGGGSTTSDGVYVLDVLAKSAAKTGTLPTPQ